MYFKFNILKYFCICILNLFIFISFGKAIDIKFLKLYNGLEFYLIKNNNPIITYSTWVKAGGIDESNSKLGVAHFLEHMMFKDNKKYTAQSFTKALQKTGGEYNAFTNYDYTVYYNTVPGNYLGLIMKLEASRIQGLLFNKEQFEEERKVILEERGLRIDNNPIVKYFEYINYHIFPGSNYGRSLIGSVEDINNITIDDLKDFYCNYYTPKNIKIFVIGNVSFNDLKRLALKYYNNIPSSRSEIKAYNNFGAINYKYSSTISIKDKAVIQPIFGISYLVPVLNHYNNCENILALILLKRYLACDTSKFYNILVKEKLLTTNINISYNPLSRLNSNFQIIFMPKNSINFLNLRNEVNKLLNEIALNGISNAELEVLYKQFIDEITYIKDNNFSFLLLFAQLIMSGFHLDEIKKGLLNLNIPLDYKSINSHISNFLKNNKMYIEINN